MLVHNLQVNVSVQQFWLQFFFFWNCFCLDLFFFMTMSSLTVRHRCTVCTCRPYTCTSISIYSQHRVNSKLNLESSTCTWNFLLKWQRNVFTRQQNLYVIWIWIRNARFELKFERGEFGPCVRQITSRCVIWNAQFKWWSRPSFELRISNYESRCDLVYTQSKILSLESSFELRISNYGLFFQDGRQFFFFFNGPHLDSGYDISLFRDGFNILRKKFKIFGKRSYF